MFVVAQISDLHVNGTADHRKRVDAVMDYLNGRCGGPRNIDALLVTGDIADEGLPEEYREAIEALGTDIPMLLTLGNHDDRSAFNAVVHDSDACSEPVNSALRLPTACSSWRSTRRSPVGPTAIWRAECARLGQCPDRRGRRRHIRPRRLPSPRAADRHPVHRRPLPAGSGTARRVHHRAPEHRRHRRRPCTYPRGHDVRRPSARHRPRRRLDPEPAVRGRRRRQHRAASGRRFPSHRRGQADDALSRRPVVDHDAQPFRWAPRRTGSRSVFGRARPSEALHQVPQRSDPASAGPRAILGLLASDAATSSGSTSCCTSDPQSGPKVRHEPIRAVLHAAKQERRRGPSTSCPQQSPSVRPYSR